MEALEAHVASAVSLCVARNVPRGELPMPTERHNAKLITPHAKRETAATHGAEWCIAGTKGAREERRVALAYLRE